MEDIYAICLMKLQEFAQVVVTSQNNCSLKNKKKTMETALLGLLVLFLLANKID